MNKIITIDGMECKFCSNAAIPRLYRIKYRRDIFKDFVELERDLNKQKQAQKLAKAEAKKNGTEYAEESAFSVQSLEMFENMAYLMHKHGDPSQPDTIEEWLEQFETFSIYTVLEEMIDLWHLNVDTNSMPKKK